jgi:hypothetical protein
VVPNPSPLADVVLPRFVKAELVQEEQQVLEVQSAHDCLDCRRRGVPSGTGPCVKRGIVTVGAAAFKIVGLATGDFEAVSHHQAM